MIAQYVHSTEWPVPSKNSLSHPRMVCPVSELSEEVVENGMPQFWLVQVGRVLCLV